MRSKYGLIAAVSCAFACWRPISPYRRIVNHYVICAVYKSIIIRDDHRSDGLTYSVAEVTLILCSCFLLSGKPLLSGKC